MHLPVPTTAGRPSFHKHCCSLISKEAGNRSPDPPLSCQLLLSFPAPGYSETKMKSVKFAASTFPSRFSGSLSSLDSGLTTPLKFSSPRPPMTSMLSITVTCAPSHLAEPWKPLIQFSPPWLILTSVNPPHFSLS